LSYTPHALLHTLGNSLQSPLFNEVFRIKGIYKYGKGVNYNGVYYDILRDEQSESNVTLMTPERLRTSLSEGQLIEVSAFLTKRFQASSGRIDLILTLNELFSRKTNPVNEEETKALAVLRQKASLGYKDADSYIRKRLFAQQNIRITILVGMTAIVDQDIKHQIREAAVAYHIEYIRINLAQPAEIIRALKGYSDTDILVIARGGGENLSVFDNPTLAETALTIRPIFITAIGHSTDEPLLQKIADKSFITPTALGQYFHDLYNRTTDEFNDSRAKLIGDLTKQIDLNYQTRLQDLQIRHQEALHATEQHIHYLTSRLAKTGRTKTILSVVILILIVLIIVFILK
jgi:exonuclease VII large subunit